MKHYGLFAALLALSAALVSCASCPDKSAADKNSSGQTLCVYQSADGLIAEALYVTGETPYVELTMNGTTIRLPQINAWAHGAEYSKDSVTWIAQSDGAIFVRGDTETRFTEKRP